MAITERDIEGNLLALVGAWKQHSKLEMLMGEAGPPQSTKYKKQLAEEQKVMETTAIVLVTGVLTDLNRIANALEHIAQRGDYSGQLERGKL